MTTERNASMRSKLLGLETEGIRTTRTLLLSKQQPLTSCLT